MSEIDFADRYAQAGLEPKAEVIAARQGTAERILKGAEKDQLLDLVSTYYGLDLDLTWFRDELRTEDPTFSLVSGRRDSVIVAATILAAKVAEGDPVSILGIVAGSIQGKRSPVEAVWLLDEALSAMARVAVTARIPRKPSASIKHHVAPKLSDELTNLAADPSAIAQALQKVRAESQEGSRLIARQATEAIHILQENAEYQREESQILWWLFGEHSRLLNKPFNALRPAQAALVGGVELGQLTTASALGPVAAPAVLERVLRSAKKDNKAQSVTLEVAVNSLGTDLLKLKAAQPERPGLCPVLSALNKAADIGTGAWGKAFQTATSLDAGLEFDGAQLARQTYYEYLLGLAE